MVYIGLERRSNIIVCLEVVLASALIIALSSVLTVVLCLRFYSSTLFVHYALMSIILPYLTRTSQVLVAVLCLWSNDGVFSYLPGLSCLVFVLLHEFFIIPARLEYYYYVPTVLLASVYASWLHNGGERIAFEVITRLV